MKRLQLLLLLSLTSALGAACHSYPYNRYCCESSDFYLEIEGGGYWLDAPEFSFGEVLTTTGVVTSDIPEFAIGHEHVGGCFPRVLLGVEFYNGITPCWIGTNLFFELAIGYYDTDRTLDLGNGSFTGVTLPALDGSGSFVPTPLTPITSALFSGVDFKRKYRYSNVAFRLGSEFLIEHPQLSLRPFAEFAVDAVHEGYIVKVGTITVNTTPTATTFTHFKLDESLQTQYFDFGFGIDGNWGFSPCCNSLFLYGEAAVFASHASTTLHGREFVTSSGTTVSSRVSKDHDECLFKARAKAGVGYQFGYNLALSLTGIYEYWGYIPQVINPQLVSTATTTGAFDRPAHIEKKTANNYGLVVGLTFIFF